MKTPGYSFKGKVWIYKGDSPWHFVTIQKEDADEIRKMYIWPRRGFGSIPVNAKLGGTTWKTSVFPDKDKTYVLPLKKEVRRNENINAGDEVQISLEVLN